MIHYHGTPLTPRDQLLLMGGKHFCVPFSDPRDLTVCLQIGQSVMFDNGAFSAFTRGAPFNPHRFYNWLEPHLAHPHWAVVPDVIDGTVEQQRSLVNQWPFHQSVGIPVWHMSLPIEYLIELADDWGRVAIGSTNVFWQIGTDAWCRRMDEAFNSMVLAFGQHLPWVHGLRMLGQSSGPWPLASADSVNVARNFKDTAACPNCMAGKIDSTNPPAEKWKIRAVQQELL